jgi:hypothetical protein
MIEWGIYGVRHHFSFDTVIAKPRGRGDPEYVESADILDCFASLAMTNALNGV